ncbi:carboxypeptidase-like regulatory domain-containing protein [Pedobacter panaciterrae]
MVTISVVGQNQSTASDDKGSYNIYSSTTSFTLKYSLLGYKSVFVEFKYGKAWQDYSKCFINTEYKRTGAGYHYHKTKSAS